MTMAEPIEELKAIAHPLRFRILEALRTGHTGELNVGEIEEATGISQPTLSQQLGVLRKASLVKTRKDAKLVYYRRDEERLGLVASAITAQDTSHSEIARPAQKRSAYGAHFARLG